MPQPTPPPADAEIAHDLARIGERLAALAPSDEPDTIGAELGAIRTQLRELAEANAEIGARLGARLGLQPSDD